MARSDIAPLLGRVDRLANEIRTHVPDGVVATIEFRADLAGLLVVSIVATYESCVKETLIGCAGKHNAAFAEFCSRHYDKLNSKIGEHDLYRYAELFDSKVKDEFGRRLKLAQKRIEVRQGVNILQQYRQLLNWRHAFAHSGVRSATIEEVVKAHKYSLRVIREFNAAFDVL